MGAAYNLARWLTRNDHDAEDVVQEAYLRAFRFWESFHGADARAWLLTIVRNTCFTWLQQNRKPFFRAGGGYARFEKAPRRIRKRCCWRMSTPRCSAGPWRNCRSSSARPSFCGNWKVFLIKKSVPSLPRRSATVMSRLARARTRLQKALQGGAA